MRTILRGLIVGALLSALRVPLGLSLFELSLPSAGSALGWRALGLALAGLALFVALRRPGALLLLSVAAGFALHGLVFSAWLGAGSVLGLSACAALGLVLSLAVCLDERRLPEPEDPPHDGRLARATERIGLFVAGAGAALALEAVARHVRLFGGGLAQDDTHFALALLVCLALGAAGLGWIARLRILRNLSTPLGLALAALACYLALDTAGELAKSVLLERYLKTFGLDLSQAGTQGYDLLVGAAIFVAPAMIAGFALAGLRNGAQAFALCAGAAQGLLLVRVLLGSDPSAGTADQSVYSAQLVPTGVLIAISGGALAILSAAGPAKLVRYGTLTACVALVVLPLTRETLGLPIRAPWDTASLRTPRTFLLTLDTPEGLATVESTGAGAPIATLDGHALTAGLAGALGEMQRLQLSALCVPAQRRARGELRVLLVGQLDPLRAVVLRQQGVTRVDRTAVWHRAMERIESKFFKEVPKPAGEILAPAEARLRLARGDYDLVLVPPCDGDASRLPALELPATTTLVAWQRADSGLAAASLTPDVLLTSVGLDDLCVANLVHAEPPAQPSAAAPCIVPSGPTLGTELPLVLGAERLAARRDHLRARTLERLAGGSVGARRELLSALGAIAAAQTASSPFESPEERVELPDAELVRLREASLALPPDAFVRSTWDGLARTLSGKRDVEHMRAHLEPLARQRGPWPELEKALARADLEALEPADAVQRLATIETLARDDFDYWSLSGDARRQNRDLEGAAQAWRRALELRPGHPLVTRKLATTLVRLGDPQGRTLIEQLLKAKPDDEQLKAYLGPGPWPEDAPARPRSGG